MQINLEVINSPAGESEFSNRITISDNATIGRDENCNLCLPCSSKTVSRLHGHIAKENNEFVLFDSSANGIYVNHSSSPLGAENKYHLNSGDLLEIGGYTVKVSMVGDKAEQSAIEPSYEAVNSSKLPGIESDYLSDEIEENKLEPESIARIPLESSVVQEAKSQEKRDRHTGYNKINNDLGEIKDQFSPPSSLIPEDWDLDPEPFYEKPQQANSKASVVKFSNKNTKIIESFLEGLGGESSVHSEQVSPEAMRALGKVVRILLENFVDSKKQVQNAKSRLSFDKISLERQKESEPLGDVLSADLLIEAILDVRNANHATITDALQLSSEYGLEDLEDILNGSQIFMDNFYKAFDPENIAKSLAKAQQEKESEGDKRFARFNDGFSSASRHWAFFQRNWAKLFSRTSVAIQKEFESKFLLTHVKRMGSKDEAK